MVTISLPVTLGLIGMVVDVGWAYFREEACRTAAQAGAFAAAMAADKASNLTCASGVTCTTGYAACPLSPVKPPSTNLQNGCLYAQQNGFTAGGNGGRQNVKYNANTTASPVAGVTPNYWVQFMATERIPTLFAAVFGQTWLVVSARSTAGVFATASGGCVYVLNHLNQTGAWQQSGGTFATGCGIYVAGTGSVATMSGGTVTLGDGLADSQVDFTLQGTMTKSGGTISPAANLLSSQGAIANPISGLTAPTAGSCLPDPSISSGTGKNIPAGTYCSGITISGGTGTTLGPGIIDITGGGFTVSGGTIVTATGGVNIYFSSSAGNLSVSGGTISITAATGGSLDGIALWKDGTTISSAAISGSSTVINGIIYMPYTALAYSGGAVPVNQTLVVNTIAMSGGTINQSANSSLLNNGGSGGGAYLIE
jgi:hypothetical protein